MTTETTYETQTTIVANMDASSTSDAFEALGYSLTNVEPTAHGTMQKMTFRRPAQQKSRGHVVTLTHEFDGFLTNPLFSKLALTLNR
jgi:chemotaxis regulatin CheY-phosphate phosphatase CheZ